MDIEYNWVSIWLPRLDTECWIFNGWTPTIRQKSIARGWGAESIKFTMVLVCLQYVHQLALDYSLISWLLITTTQPLFLQGFLPFICWLACSLSRKLSSPLAFDARLVSRHIQSGYQRTDGWTERFASEQEFYWQYDLPWVVKDNFVIWLRDLKRRVRCCRKEF